jgi:hypothetical protein
LINRVRYREAKEIVQAGNIWKSHSKDVVIGNGAERMPPHRKTTLPRFLRNAVKNMRAMACMALGDHSGAMALYSEVLEDQVQKWQPEDATLSKTLAILTSLEIIAGVYGRCEKYAESGKNLIAMS